MPVRDTSIEALKDLNLPRSRAAVYAAIWHSGGHGLTRQEIADALNWPINRVTGRVRELLAKGLVIEDGKREGQSGKSQYIIKVSEGE